jgi:hypothetical protein
MDTDLELEKSDGPADWCGELNEDNRFHWERKREKRKWQNKAKRNKPRKLNLLQTEIEQ